MIFDGFKYICNKNYVNYKNCNFNVLVLFSLYFQEIVQSVDVKV